MPDEKKNKPLVQWRQHHCVYLMSGIAIGCVLMYSVQAWSGCLFLPMLEATTSPVEMPEWQLAARQIVTEEITRAEAHLRDHFTWLIGLVGISVTIILAGFTFTLSSREERAERKLEEKMKNSIDEIDEYLQKAKEKAAEIDKLHEVLCIPEGFLDEGKNVEPDHIDQLSKK